MKTVRERLSSAVDGLGRSVVDNVTGICGTSVSIDVRKHGCIQVAIQPRAKEDEVAKPKVLWVDLDQVEYTGPYAIHKFPNEFMAGGPDRSERQGFTE